MPQQTMKPVYREAINEPTVFELTVMELAEEIAALIIYQTVEITMLGGGAMTLRFKRGERAADIHTIEGKRPLDLIYSAEEHANTH